MCKTDKKPAGTESSKIRKTADRHSFISLRFSLWGLLGAAVNITGIATVLGFLSRAGWFFDLFSSFHVQYTLCLTGATAVFAAGRRWRWFAASLALAMINAAVVMPAYFGTPAPEAGEVLRVLSMNVHTGNTNYPAVNHFLMESDADVILLMEVNQAWWDQLDAVRKRYPYYEKTLRSDNFGIAMLSRTPFSAIEQIYVAHSDIASLDARVVHAGHAVRIIGTHPLPPVSPAYARRRNQQLQHLAERSAAETLPTILLGDLNTVPWSAHFRDLLKHGKLRDTRPGFGNQPTWPQTNFLLRIPIDHALVSEAILVHDRRLGPACGSDHRPIIVDCSIK